MRRRLDLAGALVASPSVLFLDEPTTGSTRGRARRCGTSSADSWSLQHRVLYTLPWVVGILAVFVPLATWQPEWAARR